MFIGARESSLPLRRNRGDEVSDIDFQNGFVVGMALKGKMGVGSNPVPITFYNGVGVYWSTYVTIVFDQPIDGSNIDITKTAFSITGKELGVTKNYAVSGVELFDEFRVGVKCADYKNVDDYLTITYNRTNGQIYGENGRPVLNFTRQFAPGYMMPKINISFLYVPIVVQTVQVNALVVLSENVQSIVQGPLPSGISLQYSGIRIEVPLGISLVSMSEAITTTPV